jgi:geranylgeranyl diphosphate synthase type I
MTTVAEARTAAEVLAWSREAVEPMLRLAVDSLPGSMRRVAGYHMGWFDAAGEPVDAGNGKADPRGPAPRPARAAGKAIRPALVLLASAAVGGIPDSAVPAAAAVELVHNFSLLHDDVMDGDETRRHRPTAWTVFGRDAAILAGDALLALAMDVLATGTRGWSATGPSAVGIHSAAVQKLLDGQSADLEFELRADVGPGECRRMAEAKTAALLACACELGARSGRGAEFRVAHLRDFGAALGVAFQVVDDLLGIWGDPAVTGKPAHSDLRSHKKSFPVTVALAAETPSSPHSATKLAQSIELRERYRRVEPCGERDLQRVADLIEATGARTWCQHTADAVLAEALDHLVAAGAPGRVETDLRTLAAFVTRRDR